VYVLVKRQVGLSDLLGSFGTNGVVFGLTSMIFVGQFLCVIYRAHMFGYVKQKLLDRSQKTLTLTLTLSRSLINQTSWTGWTCGNKVIGYHPGTKKYPLYLNCNSLSFVPGFEWTGPFLSGILAKIDITTLPGTTPCGVLELKGLRLGLLILTKVDELNQSFGQDISHTWARGIKKPTSQTERTDKSPKTSSSLCQFSQSYVFIESWTYTCGIRGSSLVRPLQRSNCPGLPHFLVASRVHHI
jgi:hypothetical protein